MEWLNGALLLLFFGGMGTLVWRTKGDLEKRIDQLGRKTDRNSEEQTRRLEHVEGAAKHETDDLWKEFRADQQHREAVHRELCVELEKLRGEVHTGFAGLRALIKNGGKE